MQSPSSSIKVCFKTTPDWCSVSSNLCSVYWVSFPGQPAQVAAQCAGHTQPTFLLPNVFSVPVGHLNSQGWILKSVTILACLHSEAVLLCNQIPFFTINSVEIPKGVRHILKRKKNHYQNDFWYETTFDFMFLKEFAIKLERLECSTLHNGMEVFSQHRNKKTTAFLTQCPTQACCSSFVHLLMFIKNKTSSRILQTKYQSRMRGKAHPGEY